LCACGRVARARPRQGLCVGHPCAHARGQSFRSPQQQFGRQGVPALRLVGQAAVSLVDVFLARVEERPEAAAIIDARGRTIRYADLAREAAARAAAYASQGIGLGDVVLLARGVSPALYADLLALFRLGAVALFPEPAAGLKGVEAAVAAARPKALLG